MRTLIATVLAVAVAVPVAVTGAATAVTPTTATLNGTVDPEGEATTYFFEYGTSDTYGLTTPAESAGDGTAVVNVDAPLTGLTANTTYHYRLVATNASGTVRGADRTFTTAPNPLPPVITTQRVREVNVDRARLTALVDPNGTPTNVHFEYGTSTRYGNVTPDQAVGDGGTPIPVGAGISGLAPRTQYHWRMVATNAAGTVRGRDRTFTTARLPTGITLSLSPRRVVWGRSLALGGRVSGTGVARIPLALQAQRFPFDGGFTEIARTAAGSDGGYIFRISNLWQSTRYRVVTRTTVVATSPVAEASSAVLAGVRVRHLTRRRARVEGSAFPAVDGEARLQRRTLRTRRWVSVARRTIGPSDSVRSRYRFGVRRLGLTRRYRVVVEPADGGAHVSNRSRTIRVKARPR